MIVIVATSSPQADVGDSLQRYRRSHMRRREQTPIFMRDLCGMRSLWVAKTPSWGNLIWSGNLPDFGSMKTAPKFKRPTTVYRPAGRGS